MSIPSIEPGNSLASVVHRFNLSFTVGPANAIESQYPSAEDGQYTLTVSATPNIWELTLSYPVAQVLGVSGRIENEPASPAEYQTLQFLPRLNGAFRFGPWGIVGGAIVDQPALVGSTVYVALDLLLTPSDK